MSVVEDSYDIDIGAARLFLAVDELGSVSKAARRRGLSQPSATARLAKLERQLGVQLLERGPTGSLVTSAGQQLLAQCGALVASAAELVGEARSLTATEAPLMTIAATRHITGHYLPSWIANAGPIDAEIRVLEHPTAQVAALVRDGEATLGFLAGPSAPLGLRSEQICVEDLVALVAPTHHWANRKRRVTGIELATARLIMRSAGSGTRDVIQFALAQHELGAGAAAVEVATDLDARLAAINGQGIAIVPASGAAADIESGRLKPLSLRGIQLVQPIRVAWKGTRPSTRVARTFLTHVTAMG